ncbi:hypothetical protein [Tateyamaria sp.]|uniref:hypothetical protein n=1 Tax=Tateyamaria sp. TaxID=1929288 RepID=UPI003B21E406
MKPLDDDIRWALRVAEDQAEMASALEGPDDPGVQYARRMEVTLRRLAREAGYDLTELEAEHE